MSNITKQEFDQACLYLLDARPLVHVWLLIRDLANLVHGYSSSELLFENGIMWRTQETTELARWIYYSKMPEVRKWRTETVTVTGYENPLTALENALRYFEHCRCLRPRCFYVKTYSDRFYGQYCVCGWPLKLVS